jgi:hypothetical protein
MEGNPMRSDPYAGDRIDYMNARRNAKPATGGRNYARPVNPVDIRDREAGLDHYERTMEHVTAIFAEFRSWSRNLPPIGTAAEELEF